MENNRREFIKKSASLAAGVTVTGLSACTGSDKKEIENGTQKGAVWPLPENQDTPKLILTCPREATPEYMRMLKQIGIDHVLMGGPALPWTENGPPYNNGSL